MANTVPGSRAVKALPEALAPRPKAAHRAGELGGVVISPDSADINASPLASVIERSSWLPELDQPLTCVDHLDHPVNERLEPSTRNRSSKEH